MKVQEYFSLKYYLEGNKAKFIAKVKDGRFVEWIKVMLFLHDELFKEIQLCYSGKYTNNLQISQFIADVKLNQSTRYWYYVQIKIEGHIYYILKEHQELCDEIDKTEAINEYSWNLDFFSKNDSNIEKSNNLRIYQIMPDRFHAGGSIIEAEGRTLKPWDDRMPNWKPKDDGEYYNDYFYGGNIDGIIEKLSYIKNMGYNAIYLTPIFQSQSYHHYDVEDYEKIDEMLGDFGKIRMLCTEAEKLGITIICDMVFNHTSNKHPWFELAKKNVIPYKDFYNRDTNGNITFWYGYKDMPELNKQNKDLQKKIIEVIEKYIESGVKGIRFDLGEILPKEFLYNIVNTIKKDYPHVFFTSEMWDLATEKYNPQIFDGQVDSVMNYPLRDAIIRWIRCGNYLHFIYNVSEIYKKYPWTVSNRLMNVISTHDTLTLLTILVSELVVDDPLKCKVDDIEERWREPNSFDTYGFREYEALNDSLIAEVKTSAIQKAKLALALLYIFPGQPTMFMGTENAETGYKDPFCRKPFNWKNQNNEMQDFVKNLNFMRKINEDIFKLSEIRLIECNEFHMLVEVYSDKGSIILIVNRDKKKYCISDIYKKYKILISEKSTKDEIYENGFIYLRK